MLRQADLNEMEIVNSICRGFRVAPSLLEVRNVIRSLMLQGHVEVNNNADECKLRIRNSGLTLRLAMLKMHREVAYELMSQRRPGSAGRGVSD
jgi:hypothetical protein